MKKFILFLCALSLILSHSVKSQNDCKVLLKEIAKSYEGPCKKGLAHGKGVAKGVDHYEGSFKKGLPHGYGTYKYANGDIYTGEWSKGKRNGLGKFTSADKKLVSEGIWKDGIFHKSRTIPKYRIIMKQNIQTISISRKSSTVDKIELRFYRDGKEMADMSRLTIVGSTGIKEQISNYFLFTGQNYPFDCNLNFKAKGRLSTTRVSGDANSPTTKTQTNSEVECRVEFSIFEPGHWVVTIKY
jgi:hypothetical protein